MLKVFLLERLERVIGPADIGIELNINGSLTYKYLVPRK